jgi:CRISPR-associated protein Cmr3
MTWVEIRARDVWLFRDGKPFAAGEDHSATSMFPPTPLTLAGALRQKISVSLGVSLRQYRAGKTEAARKAIGYIGKHGDMQQPGQFKLRGPFLSVRLDEKTLLPLLPAPADLVRHEDTGIMQILQPQKVTWASDLATDMHFPAVMAGYENMPGHWMPAADFDLYLAGMTPDSGTYAQLPPPDERPNLHKAYTDGKRIFSASFIYDKEGRFGVATDAQTSFREEGQLFQVQFVRPQVGISLLAHVDDAIPAKHLAGEMTIGGEQRQATAMVLKQPIDLPSRSIAGQFKVVLLTPAYFKDGWQPTDGNWSTVFGRAVTFHGAVLHRPQKIGGWDMSQGRAREMHNYVAPGSVYYFEIDEPFTGPLAFTQSPPDINAGVLGFGQYAIGTW